MGVWSAPPRPVRKLRPGDHAWLAYRGVAEQDHLVGAFVQDGLRAGDKVIYVTDGRMGRPPGLHGIDPRPYLESRRLRMPAKSEVCVSRNGRFDPERLYGRLCGEIRRAQGEGHTSIRVTVDLSWTLKEKDGFRRLLECERLFEDALRPSRTVMALCQLDRRVCTMDEAEALRGRHGLSAEPDPVFDDSVLRLVRTFEPYGLRVQGEIDAARHSAFVKALGELGGNHEVHLDLAELRFIDLGGLGLIAEHAVKTARSRTIVLDHVPPQLRMVMEIVGWQRLPGLRLGRPGEVEAV